MEREIEIPAERLWLWAESMRRDHESDESALLRAARAILHFEAVGREPRTVQDSVFRTESGMRSWTEHTEATIMADGTCRIRTWSR